MEAGSQLKEYKLLVADDSQTTRRVVELAFAGSMFRVIAVPDGHEAIQRIEAELPDIVLLDTDMPGRDGYEVSGFIKTTSHLVHVSVVLLAGAFDPIDDARVIQSKCDGVIIKPCLPETLVARVERLLGVSSPGFVPEPASTSVQQSFPRAGSVEAGVTAEPDRADVPDARGASADRGTVDDDGRFERLDATYGMPGPPTAAEDADTHGAQRDRHEHVQEPVARPHRVEASISALSVQRDDHKRQWLAQLEEALTRFDRELAEPGDEQDLLHNSLPPADSAAASLAVFPAGDHVEFPPEPAPVPAARAAGAAATRRVPAVSPAVGEELIEEIVRRVMERFADRAVRELAGNIVHRIAERLVREEIDRMQSFAAEAVAEPDPRRVPRVPLSRRR